MTTAHSKKLIDDVQALIDADPGLAQLLAKLPPCTLEARAGFNLLDSAEHYCNQLLQQACHDLEND